MNDFEGAIPMLNVKDLAASIDYYVNKLGFEKKWDSEFFACVGRGKVSIFLCQGAPGGTGSLRRRCRLPIARSLTGLGRLAFRQSRTPVLKFSKRYENHFC